MKDKATVPQLISEYLAAIEEALKFGYFVRAKELQKQQIESLIRLKDRIKGFKYGAIQTGNQRSANTLFHLQCVLNAHIAFLEMWVRLKEDEPYAAWDKLIDAQEYISIAMRADSRGIGLEEFLDRLRTVEVVVFPGYRIYNSWGAVIRGGKCTICHKSFDECDHAEGLVYWGRLCVRVHPEILSLDHTAMVEEPYDKRCVVTEFTTEDGYYRDYMTWRKTKKDDEPKEGTIGKFVSRIFSNELLEVD